MTAGLPDPPPRWTGRTRGGVFGNWFFITVCRLFGLRAAYFFLIFVAAYFLLAARSAARSSSEYLEALLGPASIFRRWARVYRHFFNYGMALLDRVAILSGRVHAFSYTFDGEEHLRVALAEGKGLILLTAHTGNWEAAGHLLSRLEAPCSIVAVDNEIEALRRMCAGGRHANLIVAGGGFEHSVEIIATLRRGEIVAMMGDRGEGPSRVKADFLGRPAFFPAGAYLLAAITGAPLVQAFSFRERGFHYCFTGFPPERMEPPSREQRQAFLAACVRRYVERLESMVRKHPYQWYNFFPFWEMTGHEHRYEDPPAAPSSHADA